MRIHALIPLHARGLLAGLLSVAALAGCGGTSAHKTAHKTAGGLPAGARVVYASDQPLNQAQLASTPAQGKLVASLGFDPARDGFSFQNYGFVAGPDLDSHAMRELFGDQVCADAPSDSCTLTPAAQAWGQATEAQMIGGHCFGFAMTSLRFFKHDLQPQQFGGNSPFLLPFGPALQSEIAYAWAAQMLPPVIEAVREYTPSQMISTLERVFQHPSAGLYTLGLADAGGSKRHEGHEITPIGVEDLGGGRYSILVYDNNKPGTTQAMAVDTNAETWSYVVAPNPSYPNAVWSGRGTDNMLDLAPLSEVLRRQPCPFCGGSVVGTADTVSLAGDPVTHGHILITTTGGQRLGYVHGRLVNEVRGARVIHPALNDIWKAAPEPIYQVPASDHFKIALDGSGATAGRTAAVYVNGPGFGAAAENLVPSPTSSYQFSVAPDALGLRIVGRVPAGQPTLRVARDRGHGGEELLITPKSLAAGAALSVRLTSSSRPIVLQASGAAVTTPLMLSLRSVGAYGSRTVERGNVGVGAMHQAAFSLGLNRIG